MQHVAHPEAGKKRAAGGGCAYKGTLQQGDLHGNFQG